MSTTLYHVTIAVDVDRFSDAKLERDYLPAFRALVDPRVTDVATLRALCTTARNLGKTCFPPLNCNSIDDDGGCAGHPVTDSEPA